MNLHLRQWVVAGAVLFSGAACSRDTTNLLAASTAPGTLASAEQMASMAEDCFYYPAEKHSDGTVSWNADYVYFYLLDANGKVMKGADGKPTGAGLLFSEVKRFMGEHPELGEGTSWAYRVSRQVQVLDGERIVSRSEPVVVDDVKLDELFEKRATAARVARAR